MFLGEYWHQPIYVQQTDMSKMNVFWRMLASASLCPASQNEQSDAAKHAPQRPPFGGLRWPHPKSCDSQPPVVNALRRFRTRDSGLSPNTCIL